MDREIQLEPAADRSKLKWCECVCRIIGRKEHHEKFCTQNSDWKKREPLQVSRTITKYGKRKSKDESIMDGDYFAFSRRYLHEGRRRKSSKFPTLEVEFRKNRTLIK